MGDETNAVDKSRLNYLHNRAEQSLQGVNVVDELARAISRLAPELKANPNAEEVYQDLVEAIEEVAKTWEAINDAIEDVWKLYSEKGDLKTESLGLWDIGSGEMPALVNQKRGHCHRIGDIYHQKLSAWFAQTLTLADQKIMREGFERLSEADTDLFQFMVEVAAEIDNVAAQVLDLIEDNQPDAARSIAKGLRRELRPLQKAINNSLSILRSIQDDFADILPEDEPEPTVIIQGDNNIVVGDISDASGVAIGHDAQATINNK
ncbi:MAG: hypothetical protein GY803_00620 [Chloroflexi bacterium]|nr:hypothetical protein [Chloroflexota bacterium]